MAAKEDASMKVGFFLGGVTLHSGGIAPYATRVLQALQNHRFGPDIELIQITNDTARPNHVRTRRLKSAFQRIEDSLRVLCLPGPINQRLKNHVVPDAKFANVDLLHVPFQTPPTCGIPYVCTMHDVQELHFPEYFTSLEREQRATAYRKSIEEATRVVVSFPHVKDDLIRYFGCPEEKVSVISLPYKYCDFSATAGSGTEDSCQCYEELGPFFLYPAQTWEHKNHLRLIEAFELASKNLEFDVSLVCTGKTNDFYPVIEDRIKKSPIAQRIHFPGIVSDNDLSWMYRNSLGVVIPTLYEAGSFPLLEAMAMSTPVICSNTTSLPDTIAHPEFVFNPLDAQSMASMLTQLATDEKFRQRNVLNSQKRIKELQSIDTGRQYEELWRAVRDQLRIRER